MKDQIKIKKSNLYLIGIIILIAFAVYFISDTSGNADAEDYIVNNVNGEIQEIIIGMKNYNYYPNTINVNVNKPVSITLDKSVYGCFRDFTIRDFGIRKYLKTPNDKLVFTPT